MRTTVRPQDKSLYNRLDALQRRIKDRAPRATIRASLRSMRVLSQR